MNQTGTDSGGGAGLTILLIGHGCHPAMGSEPGITWNWAWHLSKLHRVEVLTHPHHRDEVEAFLRDHPSPNLRFHWVTVPRAIDPWTPDDPRWIRLHYFMWLRVAYRIARRLTREMRIDVVHHVGWATVSIASPFWKLGIPLFWGPLGGAQVTPRPLVPLFGSRSWGEFLRVARVRLVPFTPSIRRAVKRAAAMFAANRETLEILNRCEPGKARLYPDMAIRRDFIPAAMPERRRQEGLILLWVGRVIPYKCLELALRMMTKIDPARNIRLRVLGEGSDLARCQALSTRLGLNGRVEFLGYIAWSELDCHWRQADAFLFTSLRDTSGTVLLEASAYGLPVISLDTGGAGTWLPEQSAIVVAAAAPEAVAAELAAAVLRLEEDPARRHAMGIAARRWAEQNTWDLRAAEMTEEYCRVLGRDAAGVVRSPGLAAAGAEV